MRTSPELTQAVPERLVLAFDRATTAFGPESQADAHAAVGSHLDAGRQRFPGSAVVRLVTGPDLARATIEVVVDDMPFLVESLTAALTGQDVEVHALAHPLLAARRDAAGELLDLAPPEAVDLDGSGDPVDPAPVEAWIRLEVDRPATADAGDRLVAAVGAVLEDVRAAVSEWQPMRGAALRVADLLTGTARPEDAVAARFLRWLADDRFTFLAHTERGDRPDAAALALGVPHLAGSLEPADLPADLPDDETGVLAVEASPVRATVHRDAHVDVVTVRVRDADGRVVGVHRWAGLLTSAAAAESVRRIPVVAEKAEEVVRRAGFAPGSHSARDLVGILELFPRDELLQASVDELLPTALDVLAMREQRGTRLFLRRDQGNGLLSCLVFLPRNGYSAAVAAEVDDHLVRAVGDVVAESSPYVSESRLVRLHVLLRPRAGGVLPAVDAAALEEAVARLVRSWEATVLESVRDRLGAAEGPALVRRWLDGLPRVYRAGVAPELVADDLVHAESVLADPDREEPVVDLHDDVHGEPRTWRLRLYRPTPATLSRVLPIATDLGVEVTDERPYRLGRLDGGQVWLYDVGLRVPAESWPAAEDADELRASIREAFAAAWAGRVESDALSRLVLDARLSSAQVAMLRALVQYLRQTGLPHTLEYVARTLVDHPRATRLLVELFEVRTTPEHLGGPTDRHAATTHVRDELDAAIEAVAGRDADRILRTLRSVVEAVVRTSYHRRDGDGRRPEHVAFKIDPAGVLGLPDPRPAHEIWVHSPRVEGVHLRFGAVSRGGLRWSDRLEDFRTEVLGLVRAQVVKNSVIVPTGAKGGFVAKRLPDPAVDRDAWWAEGIACYRTFIGAMLDVTDNLVDGETVPPEDVVRHDGDDPYLVVAADKGTASFSDIANEIAVERGFWLGDAFASGGSQGYDHKAMGITARGAWESVRRHFRELGTDPQTTDITVVGVGDMSGDVFGNGMLLSEHIRLVAAFDHRHVFLDPDPDPTTSYAERRRLFGLPRSSWADYDTRLLSLGGGVHPRTAKSVPVTPQVADRLGLPAGTTELGPDELVRAILAAPVDLLWNGGIGTYVKASTEQHGEVGDKANDAVRVDAADLRVRVVGEGGNLGLTQRGRIEAAQHGIRLNTDAVDNAAGVDCSDHEVNIKVALGRAIAAGALTGEARNETLGRMTDDVAALVLRHSYAQNQTLSDEGALAGGLLPAHRRMLEALAAEGRLDRDLEALPSDAELDRRARDGLGLTVPELSVLLAHAKIALSQSLLATGLPDEAWVDETFRQYFPAELRERFGDHLPEHPLRREITTTMLVNEVIDRGGITFAHRASEETGCDLDQVVRAYAVASRVFDLPSLTEEVSALDGLAPAVAQSQLRQEQRRLLDRAVRWLLHTRQDPIDVPAEVQRFRPAVATLADQVPGLLRGQDRAYVDMLAARFTAEGAPDDVALRTASVLYVYPMLDIVETALRSGRPVDDVAATWFVLSERYSFDALLTRVSALPRGDRWEVQARAALRVDLYDVLREFTATVLAFAARGSARGPSLDGPSVNVPPLDVPALVAAWERLHPATVARARQTVAEVDAAGRSDLAVLAVALRMLRQVIDRA